MRRIIGLEHLDAPLGTSVVTIGKFFAVHRGHQALIRATVERARARGARAVVFTFDRHPLEVLRPGTRLPLLASLEERLNLIEAAGADVTVVARLDADFLSQEPETFVRSLLVGQLGAVEVVASGPFRFGRGARGDLDLLCAMGEEQGFVVTTVEPVLEAGERISSSRVAACVQAGEASAAARLLGRPYCLPGTVARGDQVGRQLGFPTANVVTEPERLLPADGVYIVRLRGTSGEPAAAPGVANLGVRPTRDGRKRLLEVHLLDWQGDLYEQSVRVDFLERLRDEQRFPDLEALRAQIALDVEAARDYFSRSPAPPPAP